IAVILLPLVVGVQAVPAFQVGSGSAVPQPTLLRLTGFVGAAPAGVTTLCSVTLGIDDRVTTLDLSAVQTLNGSLTEGPASLRQFELFSPNILLVGEAALLRGITEAPAHAKLVVFGYTRPGARRMMVVDVRPG